MKTWRVSRAEKEISWFKEEGRRVRRERGMGERRRGGKDTLDFSMRKGVIRSEKKSRWMVIVRA